MSRLDSFIRRLEAQRACLDQAVRLVAAVPGVVVELGLGNGRTYDHLRERLPEREIFVFERQLDAHPTCMPDARHLVLGNLEETLGEAASRLPMSAALAHSDIGTGDASRNAVVAASVASLLPPILAAKAIVVSDQRLVGGTLVPIELPATVRPGRYFMYRYRP